MPEDQHALPGTGDGVACVLDILNVLMRSLEERLEPPPPTLLARIRRLISGKTVIDQCRRAVCGLMRARLGQVAAGLAAAVAADLARAECDGDSSEDGAAPPSTPTSTECDAPDPETARDADGAASCEQEVDAESGSPGTVAAGACDSPAPDLGPTLRSAAFLQLLNAGVSRDALGCGEAAPVPASPPALPGRDFTLTPIAPAPHPTVVALRDWNDSLPRRVRWQEARGPDHPHRGALRDGGNRTTHARLIRCYSASK